LFDVLACMFSLDASPKNCTRHDTQTAFDPTSKSRLLRNSMASLGCIFATLVPAAPAMEKTPSRVLEFGLHAHKKS